MLTIMEINMATMRNTEVICGKTNVIEICTSVNNMHK